MGGEKKIQLLHPDGKNAPAISNHTFELFKEAILTSLQAKQPLTYTALAENVQEHFNKHETVFDGSIGWFTVYVKHHLHSLGIIEVYTEKGTKMHRLK